MPEDESLSEYIDEWDDLSEPELDELSRRVMAYFRYTKALRTNVNDPFSDSPEVFMGFDGDSRNSQQVRAYLLENARKSCPSIVERLSESLDTISLFDGIFGGSGGK